MAKQGIRRFLRFSLRSLMLLTLAIAVWLGYEVHQARTVAGQAKAIRALGGDVEFETSPWSLLRFFEPQTYGRRIATAQIPGESVEEALPQLTALPRLREVRVVFEGIGDQHAAWRALHSACGQANIVALPPADEADSQPTRLPPQLFPKSDVRMLFESARSRQRCQRFSEKLRRHSGVEDSVLRQVEEWTDDSAHGWSWHDYRAFGLADGSLAEVLLITVSNDLNTGSRWSALALLIDDECVGTRYCAAYGGHIAIRDVGGDGTPEVAVKSPGAFKIGPDGYLRLLTTNPQKWLGLYAVEPAGFRNLIAEKD